jgi:DNA helicase II / ATP-dependent DNA helicase PcrA
VSNLAETLATLTPIQREAVDWVDGALLVLAGPGSGKTQVLTCRIAQLLGREESKSFRVLALTFTNKAADEMLNRVANLLSGATERASIGTFHSFCAQVLRQHGVHRGIPPDFRIYSLDSDRTAILASALERASPALRAGSPGGQYLPLIDRLKANLVAPDKAAAALPNRPDAERIADIYRLYEAELRSNSALDFGSLIFETHALVSEFPSIANRYRRSHPYWLIDEFQDTNRGQYRLLRALSGDAFRNLFAVADDDQIIYQWNGASFRQIQRFNEDYSPHLLQLPTNYRCPPSIVEAANRLVSYNLQRTPAKQPLVAGRSHFALPDVDQIRLIQASNEKEEGEEIASDISHRTRTLTPSCAVLARNRTILNGILQTLRSRGVSSTLVQRRDDFVSAEFRWLVAVLRQASRPLDSRSIAVLADAYIRLTGSGPKAEHVQAVAAASSRSYLAEWLEIAATSAMDVPVSGLLEAVGEFIGQPTSYSRFVSKALKILAPHPDGEGLPTDFAEDHDAWSEITREISRHIGSGLPLDQFLQELDLRSKEPTPAAEAVQLMTIHAAKGREFDVVYLAGMAEDVLPSFQSKKKGEQSPEMEEERRNCFVAITRAREALVLTWAAQYRGYRKQASRFLKEMALA